MTYEDFRRHLGRAGLTVREFAGLLGLNPNTVTNYSEKGEVPAHFAAVVSLVATMADHEVDFRAPLEALNLGVGKRKQRKGEFRGTRQLDLLGSTRE